MQVETGLMVALGYGKYFRSDSIVGLEPIEEQRGPGKRTRVYIQGLPQAITASRSEASILRDLIGAPYELTRTREQQQLLSDILDTIAGINPLLRSIIRDQGHWDLDRLEEQIQEAMEDVPELAGRHE